MKKSLALIFGLLLSCSVFAKSYSVFKYDNKYGVIDSNRKVVLSPQYEKISKNDKNYFICYDTEGGIYIYNPKMELIYSIQEKASLSFFSDYEYILKKRSDSKFYLLNLKTLQVSEYQESKEYIYEYGYVDGVALVLEHNSKNAAYSIADRDGNIVLRNIEQADIAFSDGLLAVWMEDGQSGFVNKNGEFVIKCKFFRNLADEGPKKYPALAYFFNEGFAIVQTEERVWNILDKKGNATLIPNSIRIVGGCFLNGLLLIKGETDKYGYMNPKAEVAIPYKFDSASNFIGDYAMVVYDSKDAVVDSKGRIYFCEDILKKNKL